MATADPYGPLHAAERRHWEPIVKAGGASCVFCGRAIVDGKVRVGKRVVSSWHLDHVPGYLDRWRGPAHIRCNTSDGATRGNIMRGARRRRQAAVVRTWGAW